jgi:hypothetical protein
MACVVVNDINGNPTGHNVLVVGYHPDGRLIVMEPETGRLKEFCEDWLSDIYNIPITGIN